ncbi:hypothetical protein [Nocardia crassostreae]|uniref:hypothetical protein n=1 Tax=Nocardia crassostreae TaxID=53428 RepID=UPI00082FB60C|nr:hypothetical protein [Nocardia crassostreae]
MIGSRTSAFATAATTFAALTATLALTAPAAHAAVWRVDVSPGASIGLGSLRYGSSCSYTVTVEGRPGDAAWFHDIGAYGTFSPQSVTIGSNGRATTNWTPQVAGWHRIYADSYFGQASTDYFEVGTCINLGSACVVLR